MIVCTIQKEIMWHHEGLFNLLRLIEYAMYWSEKEKQPKIIGTQARLSACRTSVPNNRFYARLQNHKFCTVDNVWLIIIFGLH